MLKEPLGKLMENFVKEENRILMLFCFIMSNQFLLSEQIFVNSPISLPTVFRIRPGLPGEMLSLKP